MDDFPHLKELQQIINSHDQCIGDLNACLVTYYPSGHVESRPHADNSSYICGDSSICNFSLGDTRKIAFFNAALHSSPPLKTVKLEDRSLLVMQPNCQNQLKHVVLPDATAGNRFCISFRKVVPLNPAMENENQNAGPPKEVTILLGNSITKRINPVKIVGKYSGAEFINSSTGGARIEDISQKIDKLYSGSLEEIANHPNQQNLILKNNIITIVTNDIRYKKNGVNSLYSPLIGLLCKCRQLFPQVKLFVQSCIPMIIENPWTVNNVLEYNSLLRRCCHETSDCTFIDIFDKFLDNNLCYPLPTLYHYTLHPNYKGLGIIARAVIKIVRNMIYYDMKI